MTVPATPVERGAAPVQVTRDANPWLDMRVMNMAHQGGEGEAPSNTMYAFKRSLGLDADMLEFDVHATADGQLAVIHDATVDRTTEGTGYVSDMTLEQVQALDAAYDFDPEHDYPFRGVRTGDVPPPDGYRPDDFRVPSLAEVLQTLPDVPINIEIKGDSDTDLASYLRTAELLAAALNQSGRTDIIVVAFNDLAVARYHQLAPQIGTAPGTVGIAAFWALGLPPGSGAVALQVPIERDGLRITTPEFVQRAHDAGYAVHVWLSAQEENEAVYNELIDMCVDGIMPAHPSLLEKVLDDRGIERPGQPGVDPCG
ncbi:MAG TPA: glycerophosphodiester phosphodiesterase [Nocardioidaceae bacterium]|nr:glycerophosphodiester phosphodiesterase [Nocardioidaceae bacterium]